MKVLSSYAAIHGVLGVLLLWSHTADAQPKQPQSGIALKLTPTAHERQQADPNFIADLLQQTSRNSFAPEKPKIAVSPLIETSLSARLRGRSDAASAFAPWYQIRVSSGQSEFAARDAAQDPSQVGANGQRLALPQNMLDLIHRLHKLPEVESVQALHPGPPPAVTPGDDPRSGYQGYLNATPQGIDAYYAWGFPGGDGAGVTIVDMEQGWNFNHEDLAAASITLISGQNAYWFDHGTSVLGEMFMTDNQLGGVGIVPAATGRAVSQWRDDWSYNTPAAILDAVAHLSFGDILLLEAQEYDPVSGVYYWPMSVADANYEAIRIATSLGITVVEAACNGGYDLDEYVNLDAKHIFNRALPAEYRESGAIMVGGVSDWVPHGRWWGSNHGSRIDLHGWADGVATTDTDRSTGTENAQYTNWFSGTSSASPIVVGAAAAVQGISSASRGSKFAPLELRTILATNGTPSADPAYDRVGVMPNLKAIIDKEFGGGKGKCKRRVKKRVVAV